MCWTESVAGDWSGRPKLAGLPGSLPMKALASKQPKASHKARVSKSAGRLISLELEFELLSFLAQAQGRLRGNAPRGQHEPGHLFCTSSRAEGRGAESTNLQRRSLRTKPCKDAPVEDPAPSDDEAK